uniref:VLIG-type G domain-containing protein n=1 Tax=Daphnia galeata TaxID=27404 RepID=A0A8J2WFG8_9CRUS|nr:unnamed protein product [Daphnia galeata]
MPADASQAKKTDESTTRLMNSLRCRLPLSMSVPKTDVQDVGSRENANSLKKQKILEGFSQNSSISNFSSIKDGKQKNDSGNKSLYDTLLQLIDEFDASGIAEIVRLLLERRTAIPLFVPQSKNHFLNLFRHITLPGISDTMGEDKSLLRVAVISCRQRKQSQTCEILKNLFNIESIHRQDLSTGSISTNTSLLAEIGYGCVLAEGSSSEKVLNVLVVHIIGDFSPIYWSFLQSFTDYLLIEDSTIEKESFPLSLMSKRKRNKKKKPLGLDDFPYVCVWKPTVEEMKHEMRTKEKFGFRHLYIEGQWPGEILDVLKSTVEMAANEMIAKSRLMLHEMSLILGDEKYSALECISPEKVISDMNSFKDFGNEKKTQFLLQRNYLQQAKHEDAKIKHRLKEDKVREVDAEIKKCRKQRRDDIRHVENNSLLQLFLSLLEIENPCSRVMSIRVLEKELAERSERELGPLSEKIRILSTSYNNKLNNAEIDEKYLESAKENLRRAKDELIESALNIEHLWRELSHLYTDMEPERRSLTIKKIPRLAAQHLMDGFSLELLDGDSNMIRLDWVKEVLHQLKTLMNGKRIFVLSVMGVQSSGKSTLLNTMFGIQMRTSVGQCTRGVNMQLVPVEDRPEYDYILLLDTEGTRSPEYHGLPGSEKRDNQMATLSILLSDASIVVIPLENDAAVKEILPIVLMAYQGSKLAEDNGGRLSSRMFFVYNRIDTKQKNKLDDIIQTLGTSLHTAFKDVRMSTGNLTSESPFANFKLVTSDSSSSDVCILGNVKKQSEPPGDVPDEKYGEELIQFREHIHRRVTANVEGGIIWKGRTIEEFSNYIKNVWDCICSANFIFTFSTVLENLLFDKLDSEYKKVERKLADVYEKSFKNVKDEMKKYIEEKNKSLCSSSMRGTDGQIQGNNNNETDSVTFESFEKKLDEGIFQTVHTLNNEIDTIFNNKEKSQKWKRHFLKKWENNKNSQALNWKCNLKNVFNRLFQYEYHVEKYKKKMRKEIYQLFKSSTESTEWTEYEKNIEFEKMFKIILDEAKDEFPPKDVLKEIDGVYQNSSVIKNRKIELTSHTKKGSQNILNISLPKTENSIKKEAKKLDQNYCCRTEVDATVKRIATGKLCYDDSIISEVIRSVDSKIKEYKLTDNSVVEEMHQHGKTLIVDLMQEIQTEWEKENSVPAKLDSNKEILRKHFMMVSKDVAKTTQLFAATMANTLDNFIISAFEKEMVQKTFEAIQNERYLIDARFMHKHMDLYLIDLLYQNEVDKVLNNIWDPKKFYADVLHQLIAGKVPNVDAEWQRFKMHIRQAIEKAALEVEVDRERAQTFVDQLRKEFSKDFFQSETLGSAFLIDCSGEYEDCDNGGKKEFQDACITKLNEVIEKKNLCFENQESYAKELCPKVVTYMINSNDQAALPRCDACCRACKSLCIEPANHDIKLRPHDAIHQPGGVAGYSYHYTEALVSSTCSQDFEQDRKFLMGDHTVRYKYRDYDKVFPEWKNPKLQEELPVREYILATYNDEIAEKYNKKPADDIPASYFRDLKSIKKQLENDIQIGSGDTNNQSE